MNNQYHLDGRIWINCDGFPSIGQGKIELLIKIRELGSLRQAAMQMKMSYRQAWFHVNNINNSACSPVVILSRGGKDGGKAVITPFGEKLINTFLSLQADFERFLNDQSSILNFQDC
jgi:molybdate transport system regulatory protein